MPSAVIGGALSLGSSLISGNQQKKASQGAAGKQAKLMAPYVAGGVEGMNKWQDLLKRSTPEMLAKESPVLKQIYQSGEDQAQRAKTKTLGQTMAYWNARKNPSLARGEQLRVEEAAAGDAATRNLNYAGMNEQRRLGNLATLMANYSQLANIGSNAAAGQAANVANSTAQQNANTANTWNNVGSAIGGIQAGLQNNRVMDLYSQYMQNGMPNSIQAPIVSQIPQGIGYGTAQPLGNWFSKYASNFNGGK